ncbi:Zn-dependent hydrolase [Microbulbifer marinus]|uniref:N-carbamoyl-L-amino-acid hydrolase n=1 Tax=Microbulbifer marinus TaxID=658218 RepID=A0A1H3WQH2_9GAMM|nr:Zn-dependent hydrolase [Microbulbifer marinus]SDZ89379.1 N-carbamoyl-L-amino-acid hydrolase [Microbulbifer marinus]
MDKPLSINGERLWQRLMDMGAIGATSKGGCNRQALTDEDAAGRKLFTDWCTAAGCEIRRDAIGNLFAVRPGTRADAPAILTGSHLDTQPTGGKFDGVFGVLAGLEVIESLNDARIQTEHPIAVVAWTNEEGCRFDTAMMGSAVWSGNMTLQDAYNLTDSDGVSVRQELERLRQLGDDGLSPLQVLASIEAHIEQGPVLETEGLEIGVVTGVQHMSRHRVLIHGVEAHAGPTPMNLRRDPSRALGEILPRLYRMSNQFGVDARLTVGIISTEPGSSNTVPGLLTFTVDIRHPDGCQYQAMVKEFERITGEVCAEQGLPMESHCFWRAPGVEFNSRCIDAVRDATRNCGYSFREMVSGAGHDACNVASRVATSMIFIPCRDGLSHNEAEYSTPEQVAAGAQVLLNAMVKLAEGQCNEARDSTTRPLNTFA